jgi:hypothetical protein
MRGQTTNFWLSKRQKQNKHIRDLQTIRLAYSQDILNKRYDLYTWMDGKARLSLTINSVLFGFSYWLIINYSGSAVSKALIITGIIVLGVSILVLLTVVLPTMKSPIWKKIPNQLIVKQPRTIIGVNEFENQSEYLKTIQSLTIDDMLKYNVDQIWKMNKIVLVSSERMVLAIWLARMAVTLLICALLYTSLIIHIA